MVLIIKEVEKKTQIKLGGNELAETHTLSSRLIEDRCYLDLFLSPSLSPFVGCGVWSIIAHCN
ncbi:hypothetical protein GIB67_039141 [Kingdonia uniflora]|uniref:Uncharacterized protein n=1 Tax=Kingdonia uniflora TaxID=39325 RepID=A0A7J7MM00_9MAGN|nr:hypothetical protein GIB67_039141 [Kingdonia uniflora]